MLLACCLVVTGLLVSYSAVAGLLLGCCWYFPGLLLSCCWVVVGLLSGCCCAVLVLLLSGLSW